MTTLGSNQYLPSIELSTTSQFTDNLTKAAGRNTFKVGFQYQRLGFNILQPPSGRGTWSFSGDYTEVPSTTGGNTGLAQMLLTPIPGTVPGAADDVGGADSINASNISTTSMKRNYFAGYFQDDVKVKPRLTVNLGLRYEYFGQLTENYGAQSNFQPSATVGGVSTLLLTNQRCNTPFSPDFEAAAAAENITIQCSGQPGLGVSQKANFSPRVGFAYQLTNKFVVRGGYGIFYGGFENSALLTYNDLRGGRTRRRRTDRRGLPQQNSLHAGVQLNHAISTHRERHHPSGLRRQHRSSPRRIRKSEYSPRDSTAGPELARLFSVS